MNIARPWLRLTRSVSYLTAATLISVIAVICAFSSASGDQELAPGSPDLILLNGNVLTMSDAGRRAEAIAIGHGRILATGTDAEIARLAAPKTRILDLHGHLTAPGFVDAHSHTNGVPPDYSTRAMALLKARRNGSEWVFPSTSASGHIEPWSLRKKHYRTCEKSKVERFPLYTLRHTCLSRWAASLDPFTLAYLAGHRDMSTTKRYVHPQPDTVRKALERARRK